MLLLPNSNATKEVDRLIIFLRDYYQSHLVASVKGCILFWHSKSVTVFELGSF